MLKVYHLSGLNKAEVKRLNANGWDSEPRFARYADITSDGTPAQVAIALLEREYALVAIVASDDINDGFRLTNHIEEDWRNNEGVIALPGEHRSTSVGDIIVQDAVTSIVSKFGFTPLTSANSNLSLGSPS